jgi:crotonobetainyl-CoA:carnitine CoA-transferase CaiB-like acyl-CoA transferase
MLSGQPLSGLRILTFEAVGAGPFGSMYLADLGAEVIKIENHLTDGDATRSMGPHFLGPQDSHFFQCFNLNKKSVALNVKTPEGREIFHRLAAKADAVLNNLRGDQPEKLGLDYASLKDINPAIVCAHLSAYGRDNERKAWPGYDYLMQAEAGFMSVTGEPDGAPTRMGLSIIDYMTGITTALAMVSKLYQVRDTGVGGDIDVSLFDVALHQLSYPGAWYINEQDEIQRQPRSAHPAQVPVQLFPTSDGWVFVMCMTDKFWQILVDELGRPDLDEDERFHSAAARRINRAVLTEILDEIFRQESTESWLDRLRRKMPAAPVLSLGQALDNPFLRETGMRRGVPHPQKPDYEALANPIKLDGKRPDSKAGPALGADTRALLGELGYSEGEVDELARNSVIGEPRGTA